MTGPPPTSAPLGGPPPQPFPVFPFPPHMRYKPNETFVPHLAYMEGQFAAQALLVDQQRRIKALEAELASTQMELMRLRSSMAANHTTVVTPRIQQTQMRPDVSPLPVASPSTPQLHDDPKKASSRYWTAEEHTRFLEGLEMFGQKDIKSIARHVGTRSATQVRTHAQKYYLRIERERAKAEVEEKLPDRLVNGKRPSPKSHKVSPTLNPSRGNSNQSHNAPPVPSPHPSNSHSNSHNSSSSNRNLGNHNNTNTSNSRSDFSNNPDSAVAPPVSAGAATPIPSSLVYPAQPFLAPALGAAITTASGASVSVPHLSCPSAGSLPTPVKPYTQSSPDRQHRNGIVSCTPIMSAASRGQGETAQSSAIKSEPRPSPSAMNAVEEKPLRQKKACDRQQSPKTPKIKDEPLLRDSGKRHAPSTPRRSPKKRAKKPSVPPSPRKLSTVTGSSAHSAATTQSPVRMQMTSCAMPSRSAPQTAAPMQSTSAAPQTKAAMLASAPMQTCSPTLRPAPSKQIAPGSLPPSAPTSRPMMESGGSMSNLRALLKMPEDVGPSSSKPPALRRNSSSNSVLAELAKNVGVLSRSNSFISPSGKGVTRSNSILSLLSGIPTGLRESPSTDRLLGLDTAEDKVLATLKAMDAGNGTIAGLGGPSLAATNPVGAMGDRSFSFGQLNHMGLDDLEDPGAVALALQEEQKWGDG